MKNRDGKRLRAEGETKLSCRRRATEREDILQRLRQPERLSLLLYNIFKNTDNQILIILQLR